MSATDDLITTAVHAARVPRMVNRPASEAIHQASTWEFATLAEAEAVFEERALGAAYGNKGVPNLRGLESVLAELENAESVIATNAGMSAISSTLTALLRPGDRVIVSRDLFGVTAALLRWLEGNSITTSWTDGSLTELEAALTTPARIVLGETISNPRVRVPDLDAISRAAHAAGALLVVDNTFAGPYHCRALDHGVDIVIESVTKSLAGHHDVIAGAIAGSREHIDPIRRLVSLTGAAISPFDAWLATRGIATYPLRQQQSSATAAKLARWLERQPAVTRVHYPGLPSHADHDIARRVLRRGFGSIMSLELAADRAGVERFLAALSRIRLVHSLGGATTTLSHSATMTHRLLTAEARAAIGIHDGFFRLAVGLESYESLRRELAAGLAAI